MSDTRNKARQEQLSEALGILRAMRRALATAQDDIGDASLDAKDGSPLDALHDAAINLDEALAKLIDQCRASRDAFKP